MIVEMQSVPKLVSLSKMTPGKMGIIRKMGGVPNTDIVGQTIIRTHEGYIILRRREEELDVPGFIRLNLFGKSADDIMIDLFPPGFEIKLIQE